MSVVISRSEPRAGAAPTPVQRIRGVGRVSYRVDADGRARLRELYQADPVRILFPVPPRGEIPSAVFVTTSGGLVGGDRLRIAVRAGAGAMVQATAQAAEKVYRSTGADCRIDVTLRAGPGAWLEWLPQETIVFDRARLVRRSRVVVAPGGRLLAGEILVLGRGAMGETVRRGLVRDSWEVHRDDRLVWADALCLEGAIDETADHPAGLGGAKAVATVIHVADDAAEYRDQARALLAQAPAGVRAGATVVNGVLVMRFLAADPYPLRRAFGRFWAGFRHAAAGLPAALPRLWHI